MQFEGQVQCWQFYRPFKDFPVTHKPSHVKTLLLCFSSPFFTNVSHSSNTATASQGDLARNNLLELYCYMKYLVSFPVRKLQCYIFPVRRVEIIAPWVLLWKSCSFFLSEKKDNALEDRQFDQHPCCSILCNYYLVDLDTENC